MKVLNKYHLKEIPENSVYIGRPSVFGNPFEIGKNGDRQQVLNLYGDYLTNKLKDDDFRNKVKNLYGKDLVCFCSPQKCHGDLLIKACLALNSGEKVEFEKVEIKEQKDLF